MVSVIYSRDFTAVNISAKHLLTVCSNMLIHPSFKVYPDPVRVLTIGASLNELTNDPQAGYKHSVEFCGGT